VTDIRADLYSLGATVHALIAGRSVFVADTVSELFEEIRETPPARLKKVQPSLPDALEHALLKLLAKRPEDRFQTPAEMLIELERVAQDQGVPV
jgi:serine/threonine protein kinase